jgi:hypothetical protein
MFWTEPRQRRSLTKPAGRTNWNGYRYITLDAKSYPAHRIAWALHYGEWPLDEVDHIDLNPSNNRIENLREATRSQNCCNRQKRNGTKNTHKGVCWYPSRQRWYARLTVEGKNYFLGSFKTEVEAVRAYTDAIREHHGEFARAA